MAIEYNFTLDMDRSKRDNNIAYARTGDVDSIVINADLVFNGAAYTPSGTNAFFECVTPNGRSIRAAAEKTGSSVSVEVPPAAFQAAGVINVAYFRFESGETDNPTYVESTEPFAIVVREGIGDSIDAGDYIEEWRALADQLEKVVADVEQKAEQAETAINEQKTEVDQLKAQAQKAIAGDVTDVEDAAQAAITAINQEKADVANAAEGITEAGEQAINKFNTDSQQAVDTFNENSQQAISQFNSNGASAISKFNTDITAAIDQFNTDSKAAIDKFNTDADGKLGEVDDMITEAQGDVDAAVTQLKTATDKAVDAMEDALDGTTAGSLQNAINRTLKLDVADMTNIPDNSSLSSFTDVGSYCCKTAVTAATIGDCPIDDSPFNMYVFSSATSGQVMQLVVPIDLNGKPTAEWHVRFGTSSAMDLWSVIGGGADIAAGLGIDVTGDAQKTVSLDTEAFYKHHEAALVIQGSTEVTGGGRVKELRVKGKTWVNRWPSINGRIAGITVSTDETGLITVSGARDDGGDGTGQTASLGAEIALVAGRTYAFSLSDAKGTVIGSDKTGIMVFINGDGSPYWELNLGGKTSGTITVPAQATNIKAYVGVTKTVSGTVNASFRVMLVEGAEAPDCFTPPASITSVQTGNLVTTGKNLIPENVEYYYTSYSAGIGFIVNDNPVKFPLTSRAESDGYGFVIPVTAGEKYTISYDDAYFTSGKQVSIRCALFRNVEDAHDPKKAVGAVVSGVTTSITSATATCPGVLLVAFAGVWTDGTQNVGTFEKVASGLQLELGSTATAYEPSTVTTTPLPEVELRGLPNGTADELVIGADGTCRVERRFAQKTIDAEHPISLPTFSPASGTDLPYVIFNEMFPEFDSASSAVSETVLSTSWPSTRNTKSRGVYRTWNAIIFVDERFTDKETAASIINEAGGTFVAQVPLSTEPQTPVTLPDLASPNYTVYTTSDIPAEIEAEVVKVDYLPPSDAYTREEVDKKIKDAGMPEVVPVSQGGTGVTTAAAERNRLGLGNTTGALPIANGGTGKTTAKAAQNALLADANVVSNDATDETIFVGYYSSPSDATGAVYKHPAAAVWNWIVSKIRSTFGFNSSNVLPVVNGGTGSTSAKAAQNSLLNDMNVSSDALTDSSMLVGYNASPSASSGAVHKRSVLTIWDYVVGKIRSTFGFSSSNVLPVSNGGTGLTDNPSILVNLGSESASDVLTSLPRPGVTGTLPVSHGGTGATAPGVDMLSNLGITFGTAEPPSTGTPGSIYIQYFE